MPRATKPPVDPDDAPLKRLGGGRWQTRDERFTIEPQSGTWVIVDAEQTDDFGLALVRGPFPSLTAAKAAIATARSSAPAESPLTERIGRRRQAPPAQADETPEKPARGRRSSAPEPSDRDAAPRPGRGDEASPPPRDPRGGTPRRGRAEPADAPEPEPAWIDDLAASDRGRARRLIAGLRADGVRDAEGLVRRDLVGGVPSLAALAITRRLEALGADVRPRTVADLLADGRDDELGVRWRLVDGEGRPILLDPSARRRG